MIVCVIVSSKGIWELVKLFFFVILLDINLIMFFCYNFLEGILSDSLFYIQILKMSLRFIYFYFVWQKGSLVEMIDWLVIFSIKF